MQYHLNTERIAANPKIVIVGCGGTGGFVAESLCRLFTGREAEIILQDPDLVEPHNLLRQNFGKEDIGRPKSEALAVRLAREYDRTIGYVTKPLRPSDGFNSQEPAYHGQKILIGCVDNAPARRAMAQSLNSYSPNTWLIDAGNGTNWGQVLIGNTNELQTLQNRAFEDGRCNFLPAPTLQRPDLLTAVPDTPPDLDCAAALDLTDQDPTINSMMAAWVTHVVRRMMAGKCPFMALYLDLEQGTMAPTYATPKAVEKVVERMGREQEEGYSQDDYQGPEDDDEEDDGPDEE